MSVEEFIAVKEAVEEHRGEVAKEIQRAMKRKR
jgi:hypothetical protein